MSQTGYTEATKVDERGRFALIDDLGAGQRQDRVKSILEKAEVHQAVHSAHSDPQTWLL